MSYYRQQLEDWLKTRKVQAETLLDIGGAQGEVRDRVKSFDVRNYVVLDLPGYDIESDKLREELEAIADTVFCLEVFEYLINPLQALKNIRYCLKLGAKAYVSFAFIYPTHNEIELDSTRYTENGIYRLAEAVGLRITDIWYRVDKSGFLQQFYAADGMHPAKGYPRHNATGFIVEFKK